MVLCTLMEWMVATGLFSFTNFLDSLDLCIGWFIFIGRFYCILPMYLCFRHFLMNK
jgi:hypothetical protein